MNFVQRNHGDPLSRYKKVPLHAIFLYSSLNNYIEDYIKKNWKSLSSMSWDYCDIYRSIDQLTKESDAFDMINQINANIDISKLPGILFWGNEISNYHFLSFRDLRKKDISNLLQIVFQQIKIDQNRLSQNSNQFYNWIMSNVDFKFRS
jgi:hypothetical protein